MKIRTEIDKLSNADIFSLLLFALYKKTEDPDTAALSQLAYILDLDNLLKLCEFFGGLTLKIPTVEELELLIYSLLLFQQVDIEGASLEECLDALSKKGLDMIQLVDSYKLFKKLLKDYNFNSGRK